MEYSGGRHPEIGSAPGVGKSNRSGGGVYVIASTLTASSGSLATTTVGVEVASIGLQAGRLTTRLNVNIARCFNIMVRV